VSQSPSIPRRVYIATRPLAARLFAVPLLGYALRILVGVLKLPRFNMHLRRLDEGVRRLETSITDHALDARVAALERAWRQHIPAFLNAVGTVPALASELSRLRERMEQTVVRLDNSDTNTRAIWERIESAQACMEQTVVRLDNSDTNTRAIWERIESAQACMEQTVVRLDNSDTSTRAIWERIELIRREILFELAHGARRGAQADAPTTISRILARDKVAAARADGALRLNLGCGHIALSDYVNVDMRDLPGVDVVAEVDNLPFERSGVDEIFSAHLVEHFPQEAMRRRLLPYWRDLIRPGGIFRAITPDAAAMLAGAGAGTYGFDDFREVVFGSQDYAGDYHYNLFTPDSFRLLLEEAGFSDIQVPVAGRRNGKCFEFEISARRV